jgi:integrase
MNEDPPVQLCKRYPLAFAPYDRQQLWEALIAALNTWQFTRGVRNRYRYMCRLTLDALDQCEGKMLHERWQFFEEHHLPRWHSGERNPLMGNTWRYGINVLIVARLILPSWRSVYGFRIQDLLVRLPESELLRQQWEMLRQGVEAVHWAKNPTKKSLAVDRGVKLMLMRGYLRLEEVKEADLFNGKAHDGSGYMGVGADILDGALCTLGVFARTPKRNSSRRLRQSNPSLPALVAKYELPAPFRAITLLYLETAAIRFGWTIGHLQHVCQSLAEFWRYIDKYHAEVKQPNQILPRHGQAYLKHRIETTRLARADELYESLPLHLYSKLLVVRVFFSDICLWATEAESDFAVYAPRTPPISRQDLSRSEFDTARKQTAERLKATIFDLERELPKIRAYALKEWSVAEEQLKAQPERNEWVKAEATAFWNWALLELLVQSGLRVEEVTELTALDILKRHLPDGRVYYMLHVKPSKFDRARLIPIGDGLGHVLAEIMRHVKRFYGTDDVPFCDRWDFTSKDKSVRAPYLLQGVGHPSVISDEVIRRRLRVLSEGAGARAADGAPLILRPHDCRRMFATEHLNNNVPVHVIQALLGHATLDTVLVYAKLYPTSLVEAHRQTVRGVYNTFHGKDSLLNPTKAEWEAFEASCGLRDMGTHLCTLPTGEHCPRGLVCLGCLHAQPKKSAVSVFRRMLASHERQLTLARDRGEPAGQIAARELEVERIRRALSRAEDLSEDVAAAIEAATGPVWN